MFSATEAGSSFECKLDDGAWQSCSSPIGYPGLSEGQHSFSVRATDPAGNTDQSPATRTWTIDRTAPETTIDAGTSGKTSSTGAIFVFSSSEPGSTFACKLDNRPWEPCSSPIGYPGLAEGPHTFSVRATDPAGNTDQSPATRTWTIDRTAPNTTITGGPAGPSRSTSATFTFSSSESGSRFECKLDGGAFAACSTPKTYSNLAQGQHTLSVRAIDAAGNVDQSPATRTWTVDTTVPNTTITAGPTGTLNSTSASFSFSASEPASFECKLDGGSFAACSSPKAYTNLAEGQHTFSVRARHPASAVRARPVNKPQTAYANAGNEPLTNHEPRKMRLAHPPWVTRLHPVSGQPSATVTAADYEFRIKGRLSDTLCGEFEDFTAAVQPAETVMRGEVRDQSGLHGLLDRIQSLGLELLEVRRVSERTRD